MNEIDTNNMKCTCPTRTQCKSARRELYSIGSRLAFIGSRWASLAHIGHYWLALGIIGPRWVELGPQVFSDTNMLVSATGGNLGGLPNARTQCEGVCVMVEYIGLTVTQKPHPAAPFLNSYLPLIMPHCYQCRGRSFIFGKWGTESR